MTKQAVSVTLHPDNLLWLRGQAKAQGRRSVSETLDRLLSEARTGSRLQGGSIRSVVGTIRIASSDPGLSGADAAIRALFSSATGPSRKRRSAREAPRGRAKRTRG
jgi:hypothetical protein